MTLCKGWVQEQSAGKELSLMIPFNPIMTKLGVFFKSELIPLTWVLFILCICIYVTFMSVVRKVDCLVRNCFYISLGHFIISRDAKKFPG